MSWAVTVRRLAPQVRAGISQYSTKIEAPTKPSGIARMRELVDTKLFLEPAVGSDVSPELRDQVGQEFDKFLEDFVDNVDRKVYDAEMLAEKLGGIDVNPLSSGKGTVASALSGFHHFSSVSVSGEKEKYTDGEMYVRQLFHARQVANLGAQISEVYKPFENLHNPRAINETGISTLLASGAHLGHATRRVRANCLPYIYGVREGIHIIDLQQTLASLRRVCRVAEEISHRGGIVLYVGTRDGERRAVEKAAQRSRGFYIHDRYVPGTFTNHQIMIGLKQRSGSSGAVEEVDMADQPTGRQLSPSLQDTIVKPDLVVVLNPVENRVLLSECIKMRIPTAGIVDTDSEPSLLTYPIPGNDDSLRFVDLVAGVISKSVARGRQSRLRAFKTNQELKNALREGELELKAEEASLTDAEKALLST